MVTAEMISVEDLIRTLLKSRPAGDQTVTGQLQNDSAEEIIFDVEVDGSRYLIVRLPRPSQLPVQLSPRESEIVRLVALGHSNKIIADVLSISSWTVCTHLRRIFAKLGVGSRAAMVAHLSEISRTGAVVKSNRKTDSPDACVPARSVARTTVSRGDTLRRACV
jgi:DNA-binding CsgD family transcriptional regulator